MNYPTICTHFNILLPNNSVTPLTINESSFFFWRENESSYILTIIIGYHYQPPQQKQKYDLSTFGYGLSMGSGWVHISPLPVMYQYFEIGENSFPNQSNRGKPIKLGLVWAGTHEHGFCCHAYICMLKT